MAWFVYKCPDHGEFRVVLDKRTKTQICRLKPDCRKECYNVLKAGNIRITEILDNGAMSRAVERIHDIEELVEKADYEDKKRNGLIDEE